MMRYSLSILFFALVSLPQSFAIGGPTCLSFTSTQYAIATESNPATIWIDSSDWPGVHRAALDLQNDLEKVTGKRPSILNITLSSNSPTISDLNRQTGSRSSSSSIPIIIGTLGRSNLINLAQQSSTNLKPKLTAIQGKWEAGVSEVIKNPISGVTAAYVIVGADKRGTIYGIYDFLEQAGVSPWYWWADVPYKPHSKIYALPNASCSHGSPSVKYRGIFLNDEQPALTDWVIEKFSNGTSASRPPFNRFFYSKVFELLLRLKANYLWPTMWNSAFGVDDPLNQFTADYYGIVMSTSHQEPMLRSSPVEWYQFGSGQWNWDHNRENLTKFWTDGVKRGSPYESVYTLGMRGTGDLPLDESGNIDLLQRVVAGQREIITSVFNKNASEVPQVWCLYKEVQGYYERGMRVPDDVTLLWTDDNWGNIRRLPTAEERSRSGGSGVYYHFDYVGDPRDYKWGNSHSLSKFHHQLELAKNYGADRIWIVNVGDLKPHEISIDFFMTYAWNTTLWTKNDLDKYRKQWALREFGSDSLASGIADIVKRYSLLNIRAKPELINSTMYSLTSYREAEGVMKEWDTLVAQSTEVTKKLSSDYYAAYFQLVHWPVIAGRTTQAMYIDAGYNQLYASQARSQTNVKADSVEKLFEYDADIRDQYHALLNGKWNHMASQTHLGYYYWQQPMLDTMPSITRVQKRQVALPGPMRLTIEDSKGAWPGDNSNQCAQGYNCPPPTVMPLTPFSPSQSRYFEVSAGGPQAFSWTAAANVGWLRLSQTSGNIQDASSGQRVSMSVDWSAVAAGSAPTGVVTLKASSGQSTTVTLVANRTTVPSDYHGFVESEGLVSIQTEHYSRSTAVGGVSWEVLPDYGRNLSAVSPAIQVDSRWQAGAGPLLEYDFYSFNSKGGNITVTVYSAPTMNTYPGHPITYAIAVDGGAPITVQPMPADATNGNLPAAWKGFVAEEIVRTVTTHAANPGKHTLKLYATEVGFVTEKIVIETAAGATQYSYLGPWESVIV
ncbi:hypothetical protein FRB91_007848 [Serendipita sp. 411]|nr:hypothetical protein FRB91_007848 [Serendipita sp. 411]